MTREKGRSCCDPREASYPCPNESVSVSGEPRRRTLGSSAPSSSSSPRTRRKPKLPEREATSGEAAAGTDPTGPLTSLFCFQGESLPWKDRQTEHSAIAKSSSELPSAAVATDGRLGSRLRSPPESRLRGHRVLHRLVGAAVYPAVPRPRLSIFCLKGYFAM